jgi:hypothetical protein
VCTIFYIWLYNSCTIVIQFLYNSFHIVVQVTCTTLVQLLFNFCTIPIIWMFNPCLIIFQFLYNQCTASEYGCTTLVIWLYSSWSIVIKCVYNFLHMVVYNSCTIVIQFLYNSFHMAVHSLPSLNIDVINLVYTPFGNEEGRGSSVCLSFDVRPSHHWNFAARMPQIYHCWPKIVTE